MSHQRRANGLLAPLLVIVMGAGACGSAEPTVLTAADDLGVQADGDMELDSTDVAGDADIDVADNAVADDSAPVVLPTSDVVAMIEANAQAKERWLASGIVDYDMTILPDIDEVVSDITIADSYAVEVRDGVVTRVVPDDDFRSSLDDFVLPGFYEEIDGALRADTDAKGIDIAIDYDPITGFITRLQQFFPSGYVATVQFEDFRE